MTNFIDIILLTAGVFEGEAVVVVQRTGDLAVSSSIADLDHY